MGKWYGSKGSARKSNEYPVVAAGQLFFHAADGGAVFLHRGSPGYKQEGARSSCGENSKPFYRPVLPVSPIDRSSASAFTAASFSISFSGSAEAFLILTRRPSRYAAGGPCFVQERGNADFYGPFPISWTYGKSLDFLLYCLQCKTE